LGKVMLEQNDALMATIYLKHALEIDAKNSMAHALLGRAYRTLGRKDDAVGELKAAAKLQEVNTGQGTARHNRVGFPDRS
jgi:Tfp pilus assembly protein PilF